jgi:hypothetical protein
MQQLISLISTWPAASYGDLIRFRTKRRKAMLEFIKSPDDVLAVKLTGTITGKDLDLVVDKLEDMFVKPGKIHFFVETKGIEGLELSALPHHFNRTYPLFSKLDRFGRVAVVADQAWMRVLTRFESALLPHVSYRVYEPGERMQALDFAFGKELIPA